LPFVYQSNYNNLHYISLFLLVKLTFYCRNTQYNISILNNSINYYKNLKRLKYRVIFFIEITWNMNMICRYILAAILVFHNEQPSAGLTSIRLL